MVLELAIAMPGPLPTVIRHRLGLSVARKVTSAWWMTVDKVVSGERKVTFAWWTAVERVVNGELVAEFAGSSFR
jgi:hypothetical protein